MDSRTYLVTGGCGFVGSHLVNRLLEVGHSVRVLDNLSSGATPLQRPRLEFWVGDVADARAVGRAMANVDGCFHLGAIVSPTIVDRDWIGAARANISGSVAILAAAREASRSARVIPIVYASSAAVYGEGLRLKEDAECCPISSYGAAKRAVEVYASAVRKYYGIPTVGLRLFNVYGPDLVDAGGRTTYTGAVAQFFYMIMKGRPIPIQGEGKQTRDFVYIDDVVNCFLEAMDKASVIPVPVLNVCTGAGTSIIDLATLVSKTCHLPLKKNETLRPDGDLLHSVGCPELTTKVLGLTNRVTLVDGLARTLAAITAPGR